MGNFWSDLTVYLWQFFMNGATTGALAGCWAVGFWGLLFDDDFGFMTNNCLKLAGPLRREFPVYYESPFWTPNVNTGAQLGVDYPSS